MLASANTNSQFGEAKLVKECNGKHYNITVHSSDISIGVTLARSMHQMQHDSRVRLGMVTGKQACQITLILLIGKHSSLGGSNNKDAINITIC